MAETIYAEGTNVWGTYRFENSTPNVVIVGTKSPQRITNNASNVTINAASGSEIWNYGENDGGTNVLINVSAGKNNISNYCSDSTINCSSTDKNTIENNIGGNNVVIISGNGDDYISNYSDNVSIFSGSGNNRIFNKSSYVTISTGDGNNTINNNTGNNVIINCGAGNDSIENTGASVTIDGGAGNDKIYNGAAPQSGGAVMYYNASYYEGGFSNVVFKHGADSGNHTIWGFRENSTLAVEGVELDDISYSPDATGYDLNVTIGKAQVSLAHSGPNGGLPVTNLNIYVPKTDTLICDVERNILDALSCDVERTVSFGITENYNGLQGFEIRIAEQQISEIVTFTAAAPFEIMQQTTGQFLDYKYDLRIESLTQQGILYSCRCCTNFDDILYSQLKYEVPEVSRKERTWHFVEDDSNGMKIYDEPEFANASGHVEAIAGVLGISYKNQFDDFVSTAEIRGGSTYADTIRELFGWSARIPTHLINAFMRDNCLYVIQRGHEEHVIDISNAKITQPAFTRELVRTYWGETPYIDTEVRTVSHIVTKSGSIFEFEDDGGVKSITPDEPEFEQALRDRIYEPASPLKRNELIYNATGGVIKEIYHNYNDVGLLEKTIEILHNDGGATTGKTITVYEYDTLNGNRFLDEGNVYLKEETMTIYDKAGAIIETRVITYSPTGAGQASAIGKTADGETFLNTVRDIPITEVPSPYALNKAFHDYQDRAIPEIQEQRQARQQERLIPGIVPFDTSFPIVGDDKLIEITNAIKWLNRRTKETVMVTLYDYEHLIDFNDRIALYGAEYFLVSNTLTTTPHVRDQQSLVLVRWY